MPQKRKAPVAKAAAEDLVENGKEAVAPPKVKRGKALEKVEEESKRPTRSTRAKTATVVEVTEEETVKKGRAGKAQKALTEKSPTKAGTSTEKNSTSKKKVVPIKKAVSAAKTKSDADGLAKTRGTRGAKKGNGEMDPPPTKPKASKKKATAGSAAQSDGEPKSKKARGAAPLQNQIETDLSAIDFTCKKENPLGKLPNLKISSWNVDGVRAWLKKKGLEYFEHEQPDIFCLQETKCGKDKIPDELNEFMDYKSYWCASEKEGYAGVALFSKIDPLYVEYGLGNTEFDDEGRCITAEYEKFYLVNVYVPNAGRKLVSLSKRLEWNTIFKEYIDKLEEKKPVIVCGDMNVAHNEIDLTNPKPNKRNAGFTQEERDGFTDFLGDQYIDTYRNLYPDVKDVYSFWSYMSKSREKNIGWRLDYIIVSKRLLENVCDHVIRTNVFGSDHCPIIIYLNV